MNEKVRIVCAGIGAGTHMGNRGMRRCRSPPCMRKDSIYALKNIHMCSIIEVTR